MRLRTFLSKISETRDWSEQEIQHRASDYEANSYVGKTEDFNWSFVSDFPVSTFLKAGMVDHSKKKHWIDFIEDEMTKNGTQDKNEYLRQYLKATEIHPIVVALAPDGRWDLWDGWHRVGASIATGTNTVLAIVGTPKANIIEQTLTEGQVSSQAAAKAIAADDELFDAVAGYVGWPDYFTETPEGKKQLPRFIDVLRRIRPFAQRLYRGEPAFEFNDYQPYSDYYQERGFTSWSLNQKTASYFADGRDHIVKYTDGPVQAVSLSDIATWRMRLRPDESHYGGMQAEYFVLEPVRREPAFELREEADRESNFIKVYHATPRGNVVNIKNQTLNYPFVAESPESAYQWGRHYADMEGQGVCVLEFMVDSNRLLPDLNQDTYMEIWEKLGVPPDDREDIRTGDEGTYEWLLDEIHEHNIPYDAVQDMHGGFAAVYVGYINPTQVTDWDCYSADEESVPVPRIPGEPPAEGEEPNEMDAYYQKYGVPNTNQLRLFNGQSSPVKKVQEEQVAYHGSGANFAQFATEFMGSGEGGQMRGWGLYFAQEPEVAKHYQQMMVSSHKQGVLYTVELPDSDELLDMDIPWSQQSDKVKKIIEPYVPNPHDPERVVPTPDGYWTWVDFKGEPLYNPENKHGPNWKWNSKEEAYAKGRRIFAPRDSMTGLQIYFQLAHELGSEKAASLKLKEIGIPGVQFLDQFSREGKVIKKTYNFVMYDTSRIKIVDKQAINENRLKEIHLSGGEHDEGEEALRQIAQDNEGKLFKVGAFGSYTVLSPDRPWSDTDIVLIIEYLNRYVGILGLYNEDGKLFGVNRLWLDNDVRGQDVALGLYEWVLSQGVSLFSDNSHTPGSKKLWKDLGSRHQLYLFDRMARKAKKITTPEEFERAYQDHNYVLLVKATTNESVVKEAIQGLNLSSVEAFIDSLKRVPKERVQELQRIWDNLKAEATGGLTELYHGAPDKHAQKIRGQGFELTKGRRSGFMGAEHTVDNQGIFLTDSKPMAHYFGSNRSEFERDYEILTAYVDTSKVLDAGANPPRDLVRLGIKLLYDWDGIKRSRIPIREWWWLLDMPEFVDAIKEKGFTGVKFREDRVVRRAAQDEGNTYIIFDPKTIKTKGQQTMATTSAFYQWLVANQENEIIAEAIPVAPRRFVGFTKKRIEDLQFIEKRLLRISDKVEQLKKGGETFEDTMADASSAMRDLDIYPDDVLQWGDKVYGGTELRAARALNTEGLKGNLELVLMTDREQDPDMRIMASALDRYINYVKGIENLDELNKLVAHREDIENGFREYRILDPEYPEIEQTAQSFLSIIDDLKSIQEPLKRVINAAQQYQVILDKRASFFRGESQHVPQTEDVETLWHATAYAAEIARNGFQLGTHHGRQGLGSYGRSNGISFTHDLQIAREISRSLKELTMIANGQLTRRHILGWMQSEGIDFNKARQIHGEQVLTSDDPKWVAVLYNIWISYTGLRQNPVFANIQNTVTQLKGRNPNDVGIIQSDINMKADGIEHKTAESEWVVPTNAVLSVKRIQ